MGERFCKMRRPANAHEDQRQHVCRDRDMGFNPKLDHDGYCYEGRAYGHHADQTRGEEDCDQDEQLWRWHEAIISTRSCSLTDGTPQGGIISPALANCALDGL